MSASGDPARSIVSELRVAAAETASGFDVGGAPSHAARHVAAWRDAARVLSELEYQPELRGRDALARACGAVADVRRTLDLGDHESAIALSHRAYELAREFVEGNGRTLTALPNGGKRPPHE